MNNENIAVIIVNYKTSKLIPGLIDSISEDLVDVSIFIVDNDSTQSTYQDLKAIRDQRVHILPVTPNIGFTAGVNLALKHILKNKLNFEYFFLINPDAFSCHNLISDLHEILKNNKHAAGISPQIVYLDGKPWYSGADINFPKGKVINNSKLEHNINSNFTTVDVYSGCAVLFDMEKVVKAGMFSEDLFMYYDEADLSIRLKKMGFSLLYSPQHKIFHDVSYSSRKVSFLKTYYMTRNKFMVFNESMSFTNKIYFLAYELAFHLKNRRIKNAFYHLKGYYDFLKGKKGACPISF